MSFNPQTPAGWYPDPAGGQFRRYWDGRRWTEATDQPSQPDALESTFEEREDTFEEREERGRRRTADELIDLEIEDYLLMEIEEDLSNDQNLWMTLGRAA